MSEKLHPSGEQVYFWCPGCNEAHRITIGMNGWTLKQEADGPTITPSVKVTSGHFAPGWKQGDNCWCTYNALHPDSPSGFECECCHLFITKGKIIYLNDCTHTLKGQTVELPDWDD